MYILLIFNPNIINLVIGCNNMNQFIFLLFIWFLVKFRVVS